MAYKKVSNTAERLQQLMRERGIKQADILEIAEPYCRKFGTTLARNALSQYVSGKVAPKQDRLMVLGNALNVSEVWLMGYDVPMERNATVTDTRRKSILEIYDTLSEQGKEMLLAQAEFLRAREK